MVIVFSGVIVSSSCGSYSRNSRGGCSLVVVVVVKMVVVVEVEVVVIEVVSVNVVV